MPTKEPIAPLPPVLCSDTPGTWAYDTMSRRVREDILARVFRENDFHPEIVCRLNALDEELANAATTPLTPLENDGGPDVKTWNSVILPPVLRKNATWLSAPWAVAEFYLYRRLMTALDYFTSPVDPFVLQKELGLTSARESISTLAGRVNGVVAKVKNKTTQQLLINFQGFVLTALWGNRMDLSLWPVGGGNGTDEDTKSSGERASEAFSSVLEAGQKMILANDVAELSVYVDELPQPLRMDIIVDNAGFELFCDLCLADFLICSGIASCVYVQLKAHPTFVSDAMAKDVMYTISFLQRGGSTTGASQAAVSTLGDRWAQHIVDGKWVLSENFFWVQPQPLWEMPTDLRNDISQSALVFVKGDANYRRMLGDREWDLETPFSDIVSYFPVPVCALRTLKAELGCGMVKENTDRASKEDDRWLVAGKYGVAQFCDTRQM